MTKNPATDDARWWDLIERSGAGAKDPRTQATVLTEILQNELEPDDIVAFDTFVHERIRDAYRWDLWAVAYVMSGGGCSDDGFDYFVGWLVSKGQKHYEAALANPEDAARGVSPDEGPFENEAMWYAAGRAWEAKTGRTSKEFYAVAPGVERTLIGKAFDEDTVFDDHPELAKKFAGG